MLLIVFCVAIEQRESLRFKILWPLADFLGQGSNILGLVVDPAFLYASQSTFCTANVLTNNIFQGGVEICNTKPAGSPECLIVQVLIHFSSNGATRIGRISVHRHPLPSVFS
nr:uncharacterized protein LOC112294101 [Physcomitrium patens]|eukprot:XP_024400030.1 uncharacterized protein LOC112294101 [Physcomitrella patens]